MTDSARLKEMFKAISADQTTRDWDSGCGHCEADIEMKLDTVDPLILHVWVYHEEGCPILSADQSPLP